MGALVPLALVRLSRREEPSTRLRLERAMACWAVFGFALFTLSATRLHHYGLPVVPVIRPAGAADGAAGLFHGVTVLVLLELAVEEQDVIALELAAPLVFSRQQVMEDHVGDGRILA